MKILLPNTYIKPSAIHGLGLFAARNISIGETIIQGQPNYAEPHINEWVEYLRVSTMPSYNFNAGYCMINHAFSANTARAGRDGLDILATKNIAAGEEITENYHRLPDNQNPFLANSLKQTAYLFLWQTKNTARVPNYLL